MHILVNYIYKQIHIGNKIQKILYSFVETHFLTNENPYGRSFSSRRHTFMDNYLVLPRNLSKVVKMKTNFTLSLSIQLKYFRGSR